MLINCKCEEITERILNGLKKESGCKYKKREWENERGSAEKKTWVQIKEWIWEEK